MDSESTLNSIFKFGKHTPTIIRRHNISALFSQSSRNLEPSIQRIHGVLLFVDISGFTALFALDNGKAITPVRKKTIFLLFFSLISLLSLFFSLCLFACLFVCSLWDGEVGIYLVLKLVKI